MRLANSHSVVKVHGSIKLPFPRSFLYQYTLFTCQLSFLSEPHFCILTSIPSHTLIAFKPNESENRTDNNAPY